MQHSLKIEFFEHCRIFWLAFRNLHENFSRSQNQIWKLYNNNSFQKLNFFPDSVKYIHGASKRFGNLQVLWLGSFCSRFQCFHKLLTFFRTDSVPKINKFLSIFLRLFWKIGFDFPKFYFFQNSRKTCSGFWKKIRNKFSIVPNFLKLLKFLKKFLIRTNVDFKFFISSRKIPCYTRILDFLAWK